MKKTIFILISLMTMQFIVAQVGIGTNTPSEKSILDLSATDKGFLLPRMTTAQRIAVSPTAITDKGMQVFDTNTNSIWFWNGVMWVNTITTSGDSTNDAFVNNATNTRVELGTNSDGTTARTAGTEFVIRDNGNVGIGSGSPNSYSLLDVNSTNRGVLLPRVDLTSSTLDLNSDGDNDVTNQPIGLLIYNNGTTFRNGFYFWNGIEWRTIQNSTTVHPLITSIYCESAVMTPPTYTASLPYVGTLVVPYSGGNGGSYEGATFVSSNGLTFTLQSGKLEFGAGNLIFNVTGTPTISSPNTTSININSTLVPFYTGSSCNVTVGVASVSSKSVVKMIPLRDTMDNSVGGYAASITSPNGKYSIRVFCRGTTTAFADAVIQVRNNTSSTIDIQGVWTYDIGGSGGNRNNQIRLISNMWSGYFGDSSNLVNAVQVISNPTISLGDPGIYSSGMPEYRTYKWMDYNTADSTFYIAKIMVGSNNPGGIANPTNCLGGVCSATKVYLSIEEVSAD